MELLTMEKETTGLYLSGHPMDAYRESAQKLGAVSVGAIFRDLEAEDGPRTFRDGQRVVLAGVVSAVRTRTTKNNSLMSYVTLEDDTGSMELVAFQRVLDEGGAYLRENAAICCAGRITVRDEKEPQLTLDAVQPLNEHMDDGQIAAAAAALETYKGPRRSEGKAPTGEGKPPTLWVKLPTRDGPAFHRMELVLQMFPGPDRLVVYFEDTGRRAGSACLIHPAFVDELRQIAGNDNVIIK